METGRKETVGFQELTNLGGQPGPQWRIDCSQTCERACAEASKSDRGLWWSAKVYRRRGDWSQSSKGEEERALQSGDVGDL